MMDKEKEESALREIKKHIDQTHSGHYCNSEKRQAIDIIRDSGNGEGFCLGNIIKYAFRYKKKRERKDLLKVIHYAIFLLDMEKEGGENKAYKKMEVIPCEGDKYSKRQSLL